MSDYMEMDAVLKVLKHNCAYRKLSMDFYGDQKWKNTCHNPDYVPVGTSYVECDLRCVRKKIYD